MAQVDARKLVLAMLVSLWMTACDDPPEGPPVVHSVSVPDIKAAVIPTAIQIRGEATHSLELGKPVRYEACHILLEQNAEPVEQFPYSERSETFEALQGCGAEAWLWTSSTLYVAYATTPIGPDTDVTDLRLVAWDAKTRQRNWSVLLDRRDQGANFTANFRDSFVTELERHVCAGTRWEGGTSAVCADRKDGKVIWSGRMAFWAGMPPTGLGDVFYVADLSSLTRRYPFTGGEMRHQKLDGSGGRSAYYGTDGKSLFFSPARVDDPRLVKYDLETMKLIWRMALPSTPSIGYGHVLPEVGLVILRFENKTIVAFDTATGEPLWSMSVGEDRPSIVGVDDALYILLRTPDVPNPLMALEPRTGKIRWKAETPAGTLHVRGYEKTLLLQSVRALSRVEKVNEAAP